MTSRTTVGALAVTGLLAAVAAATAQTAPAATRSHLSPTVLALACAPRATAEVPDMPLRVTGGQDPIVRRNYQPGDLVTVNAGTDNGIQVGDEYYTRRLTTDRGRSVSSSAPGTIHTSGWIRIYAVDDQMSLATITHACDAIEVSDFLEPFVLPTPPTVSAERPKPERDNYGRVLTGADNRMVFAKGDFLVIDRGTEHGVTSGSQFVLYRNKHENGNFLYDLGEAIAVTVGANSSTLQVTVSRGAIETGDLVALRK